MHRPLRPVRLHLNQSFPQWHPSSLRAVGDSIPRFPLFPLGLVLLPGEVVPLHIFEERYKVMIGECLDEEREFGIVWVADDGLKETGCSARVTQLIERAEDGRMNILVQGTTPFRLERRIEDLPYPAGDIELLDEHEEPDLSDGAAAEEARGRYAEIVERVTESRPSDSDLSELDAYGMAATLDFALEAKQDLLELRSEQERLERLASLFESAIEQLDHAEMAAERARGNGKVRFER
jgi:Lon protease-like protein